jgi:ABC-2 type transport system ATP-binding protein
MSESNQDTLIEVSNLSRCFGKKQALDNVSFSVKRGRVFGLVGENGAGKTTLMKHLLGSLTAERGSVTVMGVDPTRNAPAVLSQLGYLSEDRDLPRWMRVRELMRYTRSFFPDWDEDYAEQLREQFNLSPDTKIRNLSRGEKAKAGLLAALAHRPSLLLLDEPSSGLDSVARHEILAVIVRSVAEEGRTVVFSSHLLDEVERVADDVAMIHQGRLTLSMPMDELKASHHRFVVQFGEGMDAFPEVPGLVHAEGEGHEWAVVCHGDGGQARAALEGVGAGIVDSGLLSLDAIFMARVRGDETVGAAN